MLLFCHIQAGSRSTEFFGAHGVRLKIRVKAAAVEGRANLALIAFLATQFAVHKSAVSVISGTRNRQKTVKIEAPRRLPAVLAIASNTEKAPTPQ